SPSCIRHIYSANPNEQILMGGDSAGGNLVLAMLSHIRHPHPSLAAISLPVPLAGVILMSPWVSFVNPSNSDSVSHTRNSDRDVCIPAHLLHWQRAFVNDADRNSYTEPSIAVESWWSGMKDA